MSHNKSKQMQQAVIHLERVLAIDEADCHALPGSVIKKVKEARRKLKQDIRKRRDARKREDARNQP